MIAPLTPELGDDDARVASALQLPGAGLLLDDAALSAQLGKEVLVTHLRVKRGHSALAAWREAGDPVTAVHGWVMVSRDADKYAKMHRAAERVGETLTEHQVDGGYLLSGTAWSDRALARQLRSAARFVDADSSWQVLRYNPRRRLVAVVSSGGVEQVLRVCAAPVARQIAAAQRWARHEVPVLELSALGHRGTAAVSPRWGGADLESVEDAQAFVAAGAAVARLHAVPVGGGADVELVSAKPVSAEPVDAGLSDAAPAALTVELEAAAQAVVELLPDAAPKVRRLVEALAPLLDSSMNRSAPVELHGDLSPDQVLHRADGSGEVRLIDLDRCGLGPRARDLGSWIAACRARAEGSGVESSSGFMTEYRRAAGAETPDEAEITAWEAYAHLSSAADPFRHRHRQWAQAVMHRLTLAESVLAQSALAAAQTRSGESTVALPPVHLAPRGIPYRVRRAWPGSRGRLGVEAQAEEIRAEEIQAENGAGAETAAGDEADAAVRAGWWSPDGLELFAAGTDPKLPGLALIASRGTVISHRPTKRAVVRHSSETGTQFTKVVRRGRAAGVLEGIRRAAAFDGPFRTPEVLASTDDSVTFAALAGQSLHEAHAFDAETWRTAWQQTLAALVAAQQDARIPEAVHTAEDEARVLREWSQRSASLRGAEPGFEQAVAACAEELEAQVGHRLVPNHRDLHDKQLLFCSDQGPGLLDVDTACAADAGLDLGNLRAHAQWRWRQGLWPQDYARVVEQAVDEAAAAAGVPAAVVALYERSALLRLRCVYAFRPADALSADRLARDLAAPGA